MPVLEERLQTPQEAFLIRTQALVRQYRAKLESVTTDTERNAILAQLQAWEEQLRHGGRPRPQSQVDLLKSEIAELKAQVLKLLGMGDRSAATPS